MRATGLCARAQPCYSRTYTACLRNLVFTGKRKDKVREIGAGGELNSGPCMQGDGLLVPGLEHCRSFVRMALFIRFI